MIEQAIQEINSIDWKVGYQTKKKWLERLEKAEWANYSLDTPYHQDDCYQVIDNYRDYYCLRIFEYSQETYRIFFNDNNLIGGIYKYKKLGTSNARAFVKAIRQMGYHEEDHVYNCNYKTIDRANYFKYIQLDKLSLPVIRLIEKQDVAYTVEILQKSGHSKFAEIWAYHFPYDNIKKILKKDWVFKNPSKNKINFALHTKVKYQRGMLKYNHRSLEKLLDIMTFEKWKKLEKKGYNLYDYLDYREKNRNFGLPDYPKDLQKSKEKLVELIRYKENEEIDNKINERLQVLKVITYQGVSAKPFKSAKELYQNGIDLEMCIFNYKNLYANGEVDLYNIDNTASVEVKNGKIVQCRGKHNKDLYNRYKGLMKAIEKSYKGDKK